MSGFQFKSVLNPAKVGYEFTNDSMTFWDMSYRHGGVFHCLKLTNAGLRAVLRTRQAGALRWPALAP